MEYTIQEFSEQHFDKLESFFDTLSNLTNSPLLDKETTQKILTKIKDQGSKIFIAITPTNEII